MVQLLIPSPPLLRSSASAPATSLLGLGVGPELTPAYLLGVTKAGQSHPWQKSGSAPSLCTMKLVPHSRQLFLSLIPLWAL